MEPKEDNPDLERDERERTLSQRGLNYQLEIKERDRARLIRKLETKSSDFLEILDGDYEVEYVKDKYSNWMSEYEILLEKHSDLQKLLDTESVKQDNIAFNKNCAIVTKVKNNAQNWFLAARPKQDYAGYYLSRRSNISSASSHVSIKRIKEEQNKAELLARQSPLKEKQKLKEVKFKLNLKKEELELETKLKVSNAKSKVLEDLERSFVQDNAYMVEQNLSNYNYVNKDGNITGICAPEVVLQTSSNSDSVNILTVSRELNKPRAEKTKFYGSALTYTNFKRQFNSRICKNTESYDERLNYLLQFTTGEANRIVAGYSNLSDEKGYRAAFEEFEERYGDSELIAQTYIRKVIDWPPIRADDPKAFDEFGIYLRECQYAVEDVDAGRVLEYSENLRSVVQKLPF